MSPATKILNYIISPQSHQSTHPAACLWHLKLRLNCGHPQTI